MALDRFVEVMDDQVEVTARLSVGELWERLKGEFFGEWERLHRQGLPEAEIQQRLDAFLGELSDKPLEDLARKASGVTYNQGRSAEALSAAEQGEARFVIRSEALDERTCPTCAALDGSIIEIGTPGYFELLPPAQCEGGDRCRGIIIPVREDAA